MLSHVLKTAQNTQNVFVDSVRRWVRPDFINLEEGFIADSKFRLELNMTPQLEAFAEYARQLDVRFDVYIRVGTKVAASVTDLVEETGGSIIRIFM